MEATPTTTKGKALKFAYVAGSLAVGFFVGTLLVNALSVYIPAQYGGKKAA